MTLATVTGSLPALSVRHSGTIGQCPSHSQYNSNIVVYGAVLLIQRGEASYSLHFISQIGYYVYTEAM